MFFNIHTSNVNLTYETIFFNIGAVRLSLRLSVLLCIKHNIRFRTRVIYILMMILNLLNIIGAEAFLQEPYQFNWC